MSRIATLTIAAILCSVPGLVRAQGVTRTPVPVGSVTGLELALDGATSAPAGSELRWFFTLYEVVGHDSLRPCRRGRLRVLASDRPDEAIGELRTDRYGRAEIAIPMGSSGRSFNVLVQARSGRVNRDFSISVNATDAGRISLVADRTSVQPGERVNVVGRVVEISSGHPMMGRTVRISISDQDGRSLAPAEELTTGRGGAFTTSFEVPDGTRSVRFDAACGAFSRATATVSISQREAPRMIVRAAPQRRLVGPGEQVPVYVMVRRADGRPVRRARVALGGPVARGALNAVHTDRAGRARLLWNAPEAVGRPPIEDFSNSVSAAREGLGSASASFTVRVARLRYQFGLSVEGGGILDGLPSRVFVRVSGADGEPATGVPIRLESPLLGELEGQTSEAGVAILDTRPEIRVGIEGRDRCGGATATAVTLIVGRGDDEQRVERCLPIDPDGAARLRPSSPVIEAGQAVEAELFVNDDARGAPVEVVALRKTGDDELTPVARAVVSSRTGRISLILPDDVVGEILLRARPLIGGALEPVRGSMAGVWITPGPRVASQIRQDSERGTLEISPPTSLGAQGALLVVPAGEAEGLVERLRSSESDPFADLFDDPTRAPEALIQGWLAARAPRDDAAPAVLRGRDVVVMPAPDQPVRFGVLRDPVRARARFIRGRLALVVRTLEQRLDEAIPDRVSDVGVRRGRRWDFNREALDAVIGAHLLRNRTPMTLGGRPLTLEDLESLDRGFTFDNMARRVTRRRMFGVLIQLRRFVDDNDLDLWQGGSDPALWLDLLVEDRGLNRDLLYDGWGRRMTIRRAPGGRTRFRALAPLPPGWELVSAGPDGRFGTGDDRADPFARVLTSGSAYAEATGEDDLLARLQRVELSQATLTEIARIFEVSTSYSQQGSTLTAARSWDDLPDPLPRIEAADRFERSWLTIVRGPVALVAIEGEASADLHLGEEHRAYGLVGVTWTSRGWADVSRASFRFGFPAVLTVQPIEWLRRDEPLTIPVVAALLPDGPGHLELELESDGAVEASLEGGVDQRRLQLGPGGAAEARVILRGVEEGRGRVRISLVGDGSRRSVEIPIRVQIAGSLRSQEAAAAVTDGPVSLRVEIPRHALEPRGVVVLARPRAFTSDPALSRWLEDDPALVAWALAVSGQDVPPELIRQLEAVTRRDGSVTGEVPLLSAACSVMAWAATSSGTHWALGAMMNRVAQRGGEGDLAMDAAVLAALSVAASSDDGSSLGQRIESNRDALRASIRTHRDDRALMSRAAAALMLSDWRDVRGRTMLAVVREHLEPGFRGGRMVRLSDDSEDPPGREGEAQLVATAALAIAAYQAEEHELARELARGLAARAHVAAELGGEPLFWLLAARAFGVFGYADELAVVVDQGESRREVELSEEPVVLPLELPRPGRGAEVRVSTSGESDAVPLVRTEVRYLRPARASAEGPIRASIDGDAGFAGERAAWVVVVSNAGESEVERPVLLVELPAGAELDATAFAAMSNAEGVLEVERPDARGVVRVRLEAMGGGVERRLPVPLLWTAAGRRAGLSLASFPQDRAWELSVAPPTEVEVPFRPEDASENENVH